MFWRRTEQNRKAASSASECTTGRWSLACSTPGVVRIQPAGPTLTPGEMGELINELRCQHIDTSFREVLFDLSRVETIGPQWTVALAFLIGFARTIAARCRVISLNRQPAAVMEL